ncbi:hypothetical protein BJX99DRAFT_271041 [Aspergillus californicus]
MPAGRPSINLEPYKAEIIDLYTRQDMSAETIVDFLIHRYFLKITTRTLFKRLQSWGIQKINRTASIDLILHARIKVLFFQVGLEDEDMLIVLQREGFTIKARTLKHVRHTLGLYRRTTSNIALQAQVEAMLVKLQAELAKGQIEGYGRGLLQTHMRNQGVLMSRYLKLAPYGIEIYAAIDAYSRYIIWIYVGISARTAVSVLRQFLDTIKVTKELPRFVRSDQGTETILLAEAQHKLQQSKHPEIKLSNCYLYSTRLLFQWRAYFQRLQERGAYSKDSIVDQIALFAVYMPVLRNEITSFVQTWNNHSIQKQKNRPYLVPGKPFINYNYPSKGVENHGIQFNNNLFCTLQQDVQDWDANKYLPQETYNWTFIQLRQLGFNPQNPPDNAGGDVFTPFITIYIDLRTRIKAHIDKGSAPNLSLSTRPTGAFSWEPELPEMDAVKELEVEYDYKIDKAIGNSIDTS